MFSWLKDWITRRREAVLLESAVLVEDKDGVVTAIYPDASVQSVSWMDLERVEVHTNDSGPWGADVWWVLKGHDSQCAYPQGATGEVELLPKIQSLPGFDNEQLMKAMCSTSNKIFLCWAKAGAT